MYRAWLCFDRNKHQSMKSMLPSLSCPKMMTISANLSEYLEYQMSLKGRTSFRKSKVQIALKGFKL